MANEFDLIHLYFQTPAQQHQHADVALGIGDDAAIVQCPAGHELLMSLDTLVADVHFFADDPAHAIGHKALAVNLSDLAAMGAKPEWAMLSLTLPTADEAWLAEFSRGFFELANAHGVHLIGGDTCKGPLSISVQITGVAPIGTALRRDGAQAGDLIVLSGPVGWAALGLRCVQGEVHEQQDRAIAALRYPQPQLTLGQTIRPWASACIDISDGLLADLGHIESASGCTAELDLDAIPKPDHADPLLFSGGDDYQLCFTLPPEHLPKLPATCVVIGQMRAGRNGSTPVAGWNHFS